MERLDQGAISGLRECCPETRSVYSHGHVRPMADGLEILLFGTGQTVLPAPKEIKDYISSLGIQLDVMDSVCLVSPYNCG